MRKKSIRERQLSNDLSDMKNLKCRVEVVGVGKGKMKQDGIEREKNHKRLLISQNKLRVAGGWGVGIGLLVMDFGEGMCCGECYEMCKPDD